MHCWKKCAERVGQESCLARAERCALVGKIKRFLVEISNLNGIAFAMDLLRDVVETYLRAVRASFGWHVPRDGRCDGILFVLYRESSQMRYATGL